MTDPLNPDHAEIAVLAAAWRHPELTGTLNLDEPDFYNPHRGELWRTLTRLHQEALSPDPALVLRRTTPESTPTIAGLLPELATDSTPASNIEFHAQEVRDQAHRRRLLAALEGARQALTNPDSHTATTPALQRLTDALSKTPIDTDNTHTAAVRARANRLRIDHDARALLAAERQQDAPEPDAGTLAEILARPAEPPHRVEGLVPSAASVLITAQRKTGKTTLILNYARCLITGEHLLGKFPVRPVQPDAKVAILNFEVSGAQLARWAHDVDIPADRLWIENLRGRRNPLVHPDDRQALAERLRTQHAEALIVDPFGRAYTGLSQNDAGEVGAWLVDLDRFTRAEAEATDLVLTTHAGWNGERTRGSSALEDWADSIITLTRDETTDTRYIRAQGRDVELDEDQLVFDPATRWLSLTGAGNRKAAAEQRRIDELVPVVVQIVTSNATGISAYKVTKALRDQGSNFQNGDEYKALQRAVDLGELAVHKGSRNAQIYRPTPTSPHLSATSPRKGPPTSPTSPIGVGEVEGMSETSNHTTPTTERSAPEPELPNLPTCTRCGNPVDPGRRLCHQCAQAEAIAHHQQRLTATTQPLPPLPNNYGGQMPPFPEPPF